MVIPQEDRDYAKSLTLDVLEEASSEMVIETADGCRVELDGECPHGHVSPMLVLGYI